MRLVTQGGQGRPPGSSAPSRPRAARWSPARPAPPSRAPRPGRPFLVRRLCAVQQPEDRRGDHHRARRGRRHRRRTRGVWHDCGVWADQVQPASVRHGGRGEVELTTLTTMRVPAARRVPASGPSCWDGLAAGRGRSAAGPRRLDDQDIDVTRDPRGARDTSRPARSSFMIPAIAAWCLCGFRHPATAAVSAGPLRRAIGALLVVFAIGVTVRGANAWISVGPFQLQPSEFGKIALIAILAAIASSASMRSTAGGPR